MCIYLQKSMHKQMNFSVKNLFSKCKHMHIKLRFYSHLLNILYINQDLTQISIQSTLQKPIFGRFERAVAQHRNYCTIINILLEHRSFFKLLLVEEVPRNLQLNWLPKQSLHTIKRGILL